VKINVFVNIYILLIVFYLDKMRPIYWIIIAVVIVVVLVLVFMNLPSKNLVDDEIKVNEGDSNLVNVPGDDNSNDNVIDNSNVPTIAETINLCDSLCEVDADSYCQEIRTIVVNDIEVKGTCRAFSKKGNVDGFSRCTGFCNDYPKSLTECTVNREADFDCDGVAE